MLSEHDEFLLSRWVDDDLTPDERAYVEQLLARSEAARTLERQFRQVSGLLRLSRQTTEIDEDAFHASVMRRLNVAESTSTGRVSSDGVRQPPALPLEMTTHGTGAADTTSAGGGVRAGRRPGPTRVGGHYPGIEPGVRWTVWTQRTRRVALAASLLLAVGLGWQLLRLGPPGAGPAEDARSSLRGGGGVMAVSVGPSWAGAGGGVRGGVLLVRGGWEREPSGPQELAVRGAQAVVGGNGARRAGPVSVSVGPPPALAQESPLVVLPVWESMDLVGRVEVMPGAGTASAPSVGPPRRDDETPWLSW